MIAQGYGKIINVASMSSLLVPHPQKQAVYNTSKAGVAHLMTGHNLAIVGGQNLW